MPVDQRGARATTMLPVLGALLMALAGCGGSPARTEAMPISSAGAPALDEPVESPTAGPPSPSTAPSSARPSSPAPSKKPSATTAAPANDASRLHTLPANTTQVVIVQASSASSSTATLQAYAKTAAGWQPAMAAVTARIGGSGFSDNKREGDRTTPTGVYAFDATMYGIAANPGTRFAYHQVVTDDWWNENSDSPGYNTFSHGANPGGPSEPLWQISPQYTHFAVIRYNMPATPGRGSGIFLHQSSGSATLGCVAIPHDNLVALLRWLNPAANPRIVLSPTGQLSRY